MKKEKTVLVLPGTRWQIPLVQRLKNRGYYVVVLDLYDNQPAYAYADEYRIADILDKERCLEIVREYNPIAVMSDESDIAVPTVAWVSEQLGQPSIGIEMAKLYTDKYKMRVFAKKNGFDTPDFYLCSTVEKAVKIFCDYGRKMIMKPLDANSSRGVFSVKSTQDIMDHFEESIFYSKIEKAILLEEYITGQEFSIDGLKCGNQFYPLAIAKKTHYDDNENLDQALLFSKRDQLYDYQLLTDINKQYVNKTGLEFGLTHAEYKYQNGKYYLIEIGARGGGNLISSVINPELTGISTQEYLIDWATGTPSDQIEVRGRNISKNQCAILEFFDTKGREGVVRDISGKKLLADCPHIKMFEFFYNIGDVAKKTKDGGTRFGYYIACCENEDELQKTVDKIQKAIQIVIE